MARYKVEIRVVEVIDWPELNQTEPVHYNKELDTEWQSQEKAEEVARSLVETGNKG
jgi:hypothetical protein